ncbi:helix-turn-helix domain-containing protein [Rhizobium sp. TRM96647]|uniref:helix-turn-helix domain-containing protein n=1 Tax=unclassified Rhizobium TaxID=2613769 RepID=UPI0021E822E8|nr:MULTISPECIES: helix-turn-helix domain-containing protein [unclassified Rhizobium]MCV3736784.1 helix-turn-helix domain-containing protein [Rhizobium sp. TRM96647]MCV3756816.1 helix-turn-helix domain-containing protein [Rhizobium sp. TRM96650]
MKLLDIGVLSERSGVPPSTLRYYEEIGLIVSLGRHGLRRQYGPEALTQLALISLGKTAGFSLDEIRGVFGRDGVAELPRAALHARADKLEIQIRKLMTLKDALRHVAECPAESHMECPKFRRLLRAASRSRQPQRRSAGFRADRA